MNRRHQSWLFLTGRETSSSVKLLLICSDESEKKIALFWEMVLRELLENNEATGLTKASCYSLAYVRAELTLGLYDKLVFFLEQIYILWYQCVLWVRWETEPWQKGNCRRVNLFGMVKEAILWGTADYNIRNSVMWQLYWGALTYSTKQPNWNKKPGHIEGYLRGDLYVFFFRGHKQTTEYCFLHIMEGTKLSHWFQ